MSLNAVQMCTTKETTEASANPRCICEGGEREKESRSERAPMILMFDECALNRILTFRPNVGLEGKEMEDHIRQLLSQQSHR